MVTQYNIVKVARHTVADLGWFPGFHGTPLFMRVCHMLIILYFDKLTRSVGPVDYTQD